ncbi:DUF3231 family protein [Falsibacillus albus]|uniref:DUF3231 family protein n=1 Tax=Falsibacillus albus TaxID=2478915 RepID=A0A3L7JZ47_9BACI|nr:DUF3231 family protein [Falsibacillus albus]RLQ95554.1 DUF3231 family protein [Falsibacillus albus]
MTEHIGLTSPEVTGLWGTYMQNSAMICFFQHFLQHMEDEEIKPIVEESLSNAKRSVQEIKALFEEESFPVPKGFSNNDVDLNAPRLYSDLFSLSFVYRLNQMTVNFYGTTLTKVARSDVVKLFQSYLQSSTATFVKSLNLMLSKGIYDRPPKMTYPDEVIMMKKQESLLETLFGEKRALNSAELGEIFYIIERNYIGLILLVGLIQVTKDQEVKSFFLKGKKLAEKQIDAFNGILRKEEAFGTLPISMEVTASMTAPFSERLMSFIIATTTGTGVYLIGYAISVSTRKDLTAHYLLLMSEVMAYGKEGMSLMIKRGWMEQLPQDINRKSLINKE